MNSMVSGTDIVFETARQGFEVSPILDAVSELWPDALFQDVQEDGVRPLTAVLQDQQACASREFFVYKDRASADSWQDNGWTEEFGNAMAHFLVVEDAKRPGILQLTVVIGSVTGETVPLISAVNDARMARGETAQGAHSNRVNWETDLQAAGYTAGRQHFYDKVEEVCNALFPAWTADELACHPEKALQFCEEVRRIVTAQVPNHLVMKALMNRRKQQKKGIDML